MAKTKSTKELPDRWELLKKRREETKLLLKERWKGEEERIEKIFESARKREDWTVHLEGLPLIEEVTPLKEEKFGRDLRGANLSKVFLLEADLSGARLNGADLTDAVLCGADLRGANLSKADLTDAVLCEIDLRGASLSGAILSGADLSDANLSGADLSDADLRCSDLRRANLEKAQVSGVKYNRCAKYRSILVANCWGSPRFKRFAQDKDYLEELTETRCGKMKYWVWFISADCGRSISPWIGWSVFFAIGFAVVFYRLGSEAFESRFLDWSIFTALYYSVVTFTTLGFGDVVPKTYGAAGWVMAEVITGYIMLGGLISILATKLARRS